MRKFILLLALCQLTGAEQVTGKLTRAQNNQLEIKSEPDQQILKFELRGHSLPATIKIGDRITVDYSPERVAVASPQGQRQCLQYLVVNSVRSAGK